MLIEEQIQDYFERSGDDSITPGIPLVKEGKGFMVYSLGDDFLVIQNCYGDGKYWDEIANSIAIENGKSKIKFATKRNPYSFERRHGYKIVGYVLEKEVNTDG